MSRFQDYFRGVRIGVGFCVSVAAVVAGIAFAAAPWGSLPNAATNTPVSSNAWNDIVFQLNALAGSIGVSGGNVGIGVASPTAAKLEVNGDVKATNVAKAWVTFNGTNLAVLDSYGVSSVTRQTSYSAVGAYKVTWSKPFANTSYAVVGACNAYQFNGTMFTIEGSAVAGSAYQGIFPDSVYVGCRVSSTNANADSNVVTVVAYGR